MQHVVILGAGTAGTIMANRLRKTYRADLASGTVRITVIDESAEHVYQPGLLYVPFGLYEPDAIVRRGITHVPEGREVFRDLSVEENLWMGAYSRTRKKGGIERIYQYCPVLAERRRQPLWLRPEGLTSHSLASVRLFHRLAWMTPFSAGTSERMTRAFSTRTPSSPAWILMLVPSTAMAYWAPSTLRVETSPCTMWLSSRSRTAPPTM